MFQTAKLMIKEFLDNPIHKSFYVNDALTHTIIDDIPAIDIKTGPWIAGGAAITFYETGNFDNVKDIDIFFNSDKQFRTYAENFKASCIFDKHKSFNYIESPSLYNGRTNYIFLFDGVAFNLIGFGFDKDPKNILLDFDFTCTQILTDGKKILTNNRALYDIKHKILSFVDIDKHEQEHSLEHIDKRIQRYITKGYKPDKDMTHWMLTNL